MHEIIRTFNSVGQGAFYTEEFYDRDRNIVFTMVYDCGSYGNEKLIINEIKRSDLKKDIDLLCISHFHADHINGLEYILKNYNVKKIVLPFLHEEDKVEVFLANINASKFIKEFSLNPEKTIREYFRDKEIRLTFVYPQEGDNQNNEPINIDNLQNTILSGQPISINNYFRWIYVPFNFRFNARSQQLKDELNKEGIDLNNILDEYEDNKNKIIEIYKKIKGDLNTNSLVIYSGTSIEYEDDCEVKYRYSICRNCYYEFYNIGCIYIWETIMQKVFKNGMNLKKLFKNILNLLVQYKYHIMVQDIITMKN